MSEDQESPAKKRIVVTQGELEKTLRVFVSQAPKRIWHDYWQCSETSIKWAVLPMSRFDPRDAFANYLADKFREAQWEVTYAEWDGAMADTFRGQRRTEREKERLAAQQRVGRPDQNPNKDDDRGDA